MESKTVMEGSVILRDTGNSVGKRDTGERDWINYSLYRVINVTGNPRLIYIGSNGARSNNVLKVGDTVTSLGIDKLRDNGTEVITLRKTPFIIIFLGHFQKFDKGEEIKESIPEEYDLQPEETFHWECAQFYGLAKVVSRKGEECVIQKIT